MIKNTGLLLVSLVALLVMLSLSAFTVDQREYALVFRLGKIIDVKKEPGLYFKVPLLDNLILYDKRIVTLDWEAPTQFNTSENKYMVVDSFVKWRIIDPVKYYESIKAGGEAAAETRISNEVNDGITEEFSKRTVHDLINQDRVEVMSALHKKADLEARELGVEVVDVRLKRIDYSDEISESVYNRMISERKKTANSLRSEGAAASQNTRTDADKQVEVIVAEAYREAQQIKGDGDAKAAEIYANAYGKNPEFYAFYRSQEAYKNSFKSKSDVMVLDPNSDFFKYMRGASGSKK
jgi:modulator of FtsH protease HflC